MQTLITLLRDLPATVADAPSAGDAWAKRPLSSMSDSALINAVAAAIATPKRDADTSFLTHAPLELAARAALLTMVAPQARDAVRRRIAAIAGIYARAGEEIEARVGRYDDAPTALAALIAAIGGEDADAADAALLFLAPRLSLADLRRALAAEILPALGAAAHAPILLAELPRIEARIDAAAHLLRAPLRQIAKMGRARISWHISAAAPVFAGDAETELFARLAAPKPVHSPSDYIAPTMLAVEADGYAARLLGDVTASLPARAAARVLLRVAALSMLQDDPATAPYGWTHALTMPQGVLANANVVDDETALVRIAATHALGFRATQGTVRLADAPPPKPRSAAIHDVAPIEAAGAVYHAAQEDLPGIRSALATRAAPHPDAHLAKYTLASFDAAARDPDAARLFLAAAAYLGAWWDANPGVAFEA